MSETIGFLLKGQGRNVKIIRKPTERDCLCKKTNPRILQNASGRADGKELSAESGTEKKDRPFPAAAGTLVGWAGGYPARGGFLCRCAGTLRGGNGNACRENAAGGLARLYLPFSYTGDLPCPKGYFAGTSAARGGFLLSGGFAGVHGTGTRTSDIFSNEGYCV